MRLYCVTICVLGLLFSGCSELDTPEPTGEEKLSSAIASFVNFEWSGELYTNSCTRPEAAIDKQILYTVGQLNGFNSVGRLDQVKIGDVTFEPVESGCFITYTAVMPVAWGYRSDAPKTFELILPRDVSYAGQEKSCQNTQRTVWTGALMTWMLAYSGTTTGPTKADAEMAEEDIVRLEATVSPSAEETEGKYPEYHKVWEDDALNVIAIFGMAKEGGNAEDVGARGYTRFVDLVKKELGDSVESVDVLGDAIGESGYDAETPQTIISAILADGRTVSVHAFMIQSVTRAPSSFWSVYETLAEGYIVYNGHSGLGQNVKRLARRGEWATGQYSIVFMNGCDTYAYIDSALADAHAAVNSDDPEGTKYLDIVANAMPSYFRSMPEATMAIFSGLLGYDAPMTYEEILAGIDDYEVALVTGEHDNEYTPGM